MSLLAIFKSWKKIDFFIFFIFVPALLEFFYILPENIKNNFILLPSNPTIISIFFSNFVHQDLFHLLGNLVSYLFVIFLLFNFEVNKKLFYKTSISIFLILPFVSSFLIIYRFPYLPPSLGFSAIVAGFMGFLIFSAFRYIKNFYYTKSNYFLLYLILIINLIFVERNLHASFNFQIFTLIILAILLFLNRITIKEIGKKFIQDIKDSRNFGVFLYNYVLLVLSIIFIFFLPNLIPSKITVGNSIINIASHYIGYIFGLFISIIIVNIEELHSGKIKQKKMFKKIQSELAVLSRDWTHEDLVKKIEQKILEIKEHSAVSAIIEGIYFIRFIIIYLLIAFAFIQLLSLIISPEDKIDLIFSYVEKSIIIIATIVVLTFTYSLTLDYPKNKLVAKGGNYFLRSLLNYIISMIFLIGFKEPLFTLSNVFNLPELVFYFSIFVIFLCYLSGLVMLILSAYFFATGMHYLLKSL